MGLRLALLAVAGVVAGTGVVATPAPLRCGSSKSTAAAPSGRRVPRLTRIVVVVMENKDCGDVVGSREAPYENALARRYASASRHFALTRPSLPNYLGLTGGSTFGITSDCTDCSVAGSNLVDQLERAKIPWKAYMQGMPRPCFTGARSGRYVKRHDPFAYYDDVVSSRARCSRIVPLDRLSQDIARHALPRFVWISPDLCDDTHDCSVRTGDRFLARLLPPLLRALGPRGVLFLVWDEDRTGRGNVPLVVAGAAARPGARSGLRYDHYSVLRTIEDAFGLPHLRGAACPCARALSALLR